MDFKIIIENFFLLTLCLTTCLTLETFNYHHVKRISNYQEKDDYIVLIGEKAALPCNITKPNTESLLVAVLWYRDDSTNPIYTLDARSGRPEKMRNFVSESLKNRAFFNLSYPLSYLTIEPVTENDTGKYRCRVDFKRGRTFNHITNLNVTVKPRIVKIMNTPSVLLAGDQYELVCQATGSHPPGKITWTKEEGIQLNSSGESVSDDGLVISNFLTFVPSVEDNGKKLTCSATDDRFPNYIIHDSFLLTVNFIPILSLALGSSIQNKDIMEGSDVYFECNTQSNPPINRIGWFYNNEKLQSDDKLRIQVNNSSLLIRNVARSHSGKYQCWADNKVGKGQSDIVHLDVKYTPVCRSGQRIHYGVAKHEVAVIVCEVDADPSDVYFHWSFNSTINDDFREPEEIQFTVDGLKSVATYVPKRPIDYGVLYCSASNRVGKQSEPCLFFVIPAGSPDAPENCTLTNITAHTLTVECNPGYSGGYEQTFHLEVYINASGKKRLINNLTSSEYPFFIANALPAGNSFHLVTYASNNRGRSPIVTINGNTLVAERWQTDYFEETVVSTSILLLMGIVVTLVIIAIIVILVMKIRSDDDNARKDKSNLMDLSRISGNKQEILAQNCVNKQSLEYLEETWGPDLIPAQIALENSGFLTIPVITTTTSPEPGTIEAEIYDCEVHHQIITDHHHHHDHPTIITPHHHHHHHHRHTHETLDSPYYGNHCQIQLTTGVTTISPTTTTATITTGF